MCTTTFWPTPDGYRLGMNRDEKRSRVRALMPEIETFPDMTVVGPSEPGGGRWIALNSSGITVFLVNWYSVPHDAPANPLSRGWIVSELRRARDPSEARRRFASFPLQRFPPFRTGAIFPEPKVVVEWAWDLKELRSRDLPWAPAAWISSGADEARAQEIRQASIDKFVRQCSSREAGFLRELHSSHEPTAGSNSLCMHREDAETVSFTEIEWKSGVGGTLSYWDGPPCQRNRLKADVVHNLMDSEKSATN